MYPYVAPHTSKIHTLITLGIRNRTKPLVLKARMHRPCGFDSHRPLHFSLPGVSLRCPRTPLSLSPLVDVGYRARPVAPRKAFQSSNAPASVLRSIPSRFSRDRSTGSSSFMNRLFSRRRRISRTPLRSMSPSRLYLSVNPIIPHLYPDSDLEKSTVSYERPGSRQPFRVLRETPNSALIARMLLPWRFKT
jgi:hypothetical protein